MTITFSSPGGPMFFRNWQNNILAVLMAVAFICGFHCPMVWNVYDFNHLLYIFSHANIFHLLANVFVLLSFGKSVNAFAWLAAVAASFLPMPNVPTVGMSALLFAHLGTTWAPTKGLGIMCRKILPWAVVFGLLPGINLLIHIYALFLGYAFMYVYYHFIKSN